MDIPTDSETEPRLAAIFLASRVLAQPDRYPELLELAKQVLPQQTD